MSEPVTVARILAAVDARPSSATQVFLRMEGFGPRKGLSGRLRKRRRRVATMLEALAERGAIKHRDGEKPPVPLYFL